MYLLELVERLLKADSLQHAISTVGAYLKFAIPVSDLVLLLKTNDNQYQTFYPLAPQTAHSEIFNIDFEALSLLFESNSAPNSEFNSSTPLVLRELADQARLWSTFRIGLSSDSLGYAFINPTHKLGQSDEQFVRGVCEHLALTIIRFAQIQSLEEVSQHVSSVNKELKLRQARLQTSHNELSKTLDELQQAQDELTEVRTQASLGKLVRGVAHKINSPAGVCLTASSALESICDELKLSAQNKTLTLSQFDTKLSSLSDLTALLQRNCTRISNLVETFKLASVDEWNEAPTEFDLGVVIQNSIHQAYLALDKRSTINIQNTVAGALFGYPNVLSEALGNLLINAVQYGSPYHDSTVWVIAHEQDQTIYIDIKDEGDGMDQQQWEQYFEPFVTSSTKEQNLGLGAHITYNLITQKYGGQIKLLSQPQQATHVQISIPRAC